MYTLPCLSESRVIPDHDRNNSITLRVDGDLNFVDIHLIKNPTDRITWLCPVESQQELFSSGEWKDEGIYLFEAAISFPSGLPARVDRDWLSNPINLQTATLWQLTSDKEEGPPNKCHRTQLKDRLVEVFPLKMLSFSFW